MKIYTRTGDQGETSLYTGQRIAKNHIAFDALGTVDECNCTIGIALSFFPDNGAFEEPKKQLLFIQHALFDLGAALATPRTRAASAKIEKTRFDAEEVHLLEQWIDHMESSLPPLRTFILPGGNTAGSFLHLARSICRRAERLVVPIHKASDVPDNVLVYLNRLSDYLFVASRYVNHLTHTPETSWEKHKSYN
jgi:cob(I)alamin adenosyltransferase